MKLTTLALFGSLIVLTACQSSTDRTPQEQREYMQRLYLFERIDVSRNQVITLEEFKKEFAASGKKSLEELFAKYDRDGNGMLSRTEWLSIK